MPHAAIAVALLSAATLAYEVLLVRVFAIEHFHHLATMAIGVAMLGLGAAGVLFARLVPRGEAGARWFAPCASLAAVALVAGPAGVHRIALDATQLPWDPVQWIRLGAAYGLLALPFLFGGLAVLVALAREPRRPGALYGASFAGAGVGAALAVASLGIWVPAQALAAPAALAALATLSSTLAERPRRAALWIALAWLAAATAVTGPPWGQRVSPYKGLPQVEAFPGAKRVAEGTSPVGWLVAVQADAFRHAPGLSLAFAGEFPKQTALFVDGQTVGAAQAEGGDDPAFLDWLPSALPYALGGRERVLAIAPGGDTEIRGARLHGARRIVAVELHPGVVSVSRGALSPRRPGAASPERAFPERASREGASAGNADVAWVVGDARSFVARTRESFDLVSIGPGSGFGASVAGVHGLNEDFLHTVEAYRDYLKRLDERGVLAITCWLASPPREGVRIVLAVARALRDASPAAAARGLVVARGWGTATVLAKPSGFEPQEVERLRTWAAERWFDLDYWPGLERAPEAMNVLDDPVLFRAARAAVAGPAEAAAFAAGYPFEVAPAEDARPYAHHFLRISSLSRLFRDRASALPFAEWGFVALVATALQSAALAALWMILPAALGKGPSGPGRASRLGYFAAIGLGYLMAEIALIQQLGLLLGHPVYAVAATLSLVLVFSGLGSLWSDRLPVARARLWLVALAVVLMVCAGGLLTLVHALQPASLALRIVLGTAIVGPLAFLMGVPFPVGWRAQVGEDRDRAAWAWAANGFASAVAAPASALVALEAGGPALLGAAALAYAVAAALARGASGTP